MRRFSSQLEMSLSLAEARSQKEKSACQPGNQNRLPQLLCRLTGRDGDGQRIY